MKPAFAPAVPGSRIALRASGMTTVVGVALTLLTGCTTALPPSAFVGQGPTMRPEVFFAGHATSWGVLESRGGAPSRTLRVDSRGTALPDGEFRLDQTVRMGDGKTTERTWLLRRTEPDRYEGTLTDASGPVRGEVSGNLFHLRYPLKAAPGGGMEQWMYLQDDGRTLLNVGTVRVLGVTVLRLSERITRDGGAAAPDGEVAFPPPSSPPS